MVQREVMSAQIPNHLKKYLVNQNYKKYSPEDQAVWRYIMKGIQHTMSLYGYRGCLTGMKKTGITFDKIPKISDMDRKLQNFGWRAVTVSGFIPPKAFMEFQLNGFLPIASELRSINHIKYTPAPDIVHESIGHVPFLTNTTYTNFLKKYASAVLKSLSSVEDKNLYMAIRKLSDLKENPKATKNQIDKAEKKLKTVVKNIAYVSESSYLSRFIWWTSEYGLIGNLKNPKIYGAGLISSIEESQRINKVTKIWLDENCLNYSFDITKTQPQYFVTENFSHLLEVLDKIIENLSWYQGGIYGIKKAIQSKTVNTAEFNSGLQISGVIEKMITLKKNIVFLKFSGPCQLSFKNKELPGHNKVYHHHGYSTPLRFISKNKKPFHLWNDRDLEKEGLKVGKKAHLVFEANIHLQGEITKFLKINNCLLVVTFKNCLIKQKDLILFDPSWGLFDLAIGQTITSVFSGPADKQTYKEEDNFKPSKVLERNFSKNQKDSFKVYKKIDSLRNPTKSHIQKKKLLEKLVTTLHKQKTPWLASLELLELTKNNPKLKNKILNHLKTIMKKGPLDIKKYIKMGLPLYK